MAKMNPAAAAALATITGGVREPLGVIGIIYESRPNVTADAGALLARLMPGKVMVQQMEAA